MGGNGKLVLLLMAASLLGTVSEKVFADPLFLPDVSAEMTDPSYWSGKTEDEDAVLADAELIREMNRRIAEKEECMMCDILKEPVPYDGEAFRKLLVKKAGKELADYRERGYFDEEGRVLTEELSEEIIRNIANAPAVKEQRVRYGICVNRTDVRAAPNAHVITDSQGDNDFDLQQISGLKVNDPVLIRLESADGKYYLCDSVCISGWVPAEDVAICRNRYEWRYAFEIPDDRAIVVTQGRLHLDISHNNPDSSGRLLTMGTVLRRVRPEEFDASVTNRAIYQNYPVWLPVRKEDGSYGKTIALIAQHYSVSEGFLPLTTKNLLRVAFSMLGDAYGWGGMMQVPDCSAFVREVYSCFGLTLPRNTTWQVEMPAVRYVTEKMKSSRKQEMLRKLPAGSLVFFRGHVMMYLGEENGLHYVLSTVSSMLDPGGDDRIRVRSVVINTLENTRRPNTHVWLDDVNALIIPYLPG